MKHQIGSVEYIRDLQAQKLAKSAVRAKEIHDLALLNFETWPDLSVEEKDVTNRQAQRAIAELAGMVPPLVRYLLGELSRENGDA